MTASAVLGKSCPICRQSIALGKAVVVCQRCQQPYHAGCYRLNGGCATYLCTGSAGEPFYLQASRATPIDQDLSEEMEYAGFGIRLGAMLIDGVILSVVSWFLGGLADDWLVGVLIQVLYFGVIQGATGGQTAGKAMVGIRVVLDDGSPLTVGWGLLRSLSEYISAFILCIGYLMVLWTERKQALHDMIVGTVVIRERR